MIMLLVEIFSRALDFSVVLPLQSAQGAVAKITFFVSVLLLLLIFVVHRCDNEPRFLLSITTG